MTRAVEKKDNLTEIMKSLFHLRNKPILLLRMESVNPHSVFLLKKELRGKYFNDLDVVLHTPGGHIESAYKIVKLLREHSKKLDIIIPSNAKSAGTLICLSADNLILSTVSELGPLDVQIPEQQDGDVDAYKSALNGYKSLEQIRNHAIENFDLATKLIIGRTGNRMRLKDIMELSIDFSGTTSSGLYRQIHPKSITEYARSLDVGEQYGVKILTKYLKWEKNKALKVVRHMVYDYPSHSFIIDSDELKDFGFSVCDAKNELDLLLDELGIEFIIRKNDDPNENEIRLFVYDTIDKEDKDKQSENKKNGNSKKPKKTNK